MKTTILKYITVTFAAGAMLLAGCNDLDQEPTNKFTDKAFWTSPERANMVLNMAYNQMFGHDKIWQDEALSDNLYEQRGNPDTRTIRMGQATPNTGLFRSEWKWVFEGVKTCNVFMNFVDEVPGMDPERLAGMKAQIRFIRAFLYFRLANFYGDIPFFLQDISLEESRRVSRTPYPEVMSALHRELDEIVGDLPTRDELKADDNGRITKAAAMVLKARMYMYENVQRTGNSVSDNMRKAAGHGFINATDCADYLTKKGMPFREAYMIVGRLVNLCIKTGDTLDTLTLKDFRAISSLFDEDVYQALALKTCVNERKVYGGPAKESVEKQISNIEGFLAQRS